MRLSALAFSAAALASLILFVAAAPVAPAQKPHRNVIVFVADGLRRGSVTAEDMPTFFALRGRGVDFPNSHSVFPTFTTANASVIATGHGLGDTGDFSNTIYPGVWLTKPEAPTAAGLVTPFLESDDVLADMNSVFSGNYLGETTLLDAARAKGMNVASVGKLGPTAIQQINAVSWDSFGLLSNGSAIIVDDSTGKPGGLPLPDVVETGLESAHLPTEAPLRSNGYGDTSPQNNGFSGDAATAGTLAANTVQQQWFADVTTSVLLPQFAAETKSFVLLFWSRDPDGTQHNQGDSLQRTEPGINGDTSKLALRNADHCLKQLLDWLDAHPAVKAATDVFVTSDHGFATISRRSLAADGTETAEVSSSLEYETGPKDKPEPHGILPTGFLAIDLAVRQHLRAFDPAVRSVAGDSVYAELNVGGEKSQHPSTGSALLGDAIHRLDATDAKLIIASNGGSDLIYAPTRDRALIAATVETLSRLDYVGGIFVDETLCPTAKECPGALPLSAIGLVGSTRVPRPAIVVTYRVFYGKPGNLQSAVQVADTTLQQGQGMHGGFGRDQTLNNMAAAGPDFPAGFVDEAPVGNIDIAPTLASILGIELPSTGKLKGRVLREALASKAPAKAALKRTLVSEPASSGARTVLEYQELEGVHYNDRACLVVKGAPERCD